MTIGRMESVLDDGTKVSIRELGPNETNQLDALVGLLDESEVPPAFRHVVASSNGDAPTSAVREDGLMAVDARIAVRRAQPR